MKYIKRLLPAVIISCILFNTFQLSFAAETSSYNILAKAYEEMPKAVFSRYEYGWAGLMNAEDPGISEGVLAGRISDFDSDGKTELLVLKIKKYTGTTQDDYIDPYNSTLNPYYLAYMEMYETENGTAVLADTTKSFNAFDNMYETGGMEFFTKENYIVLQSVIQNNVFADGTRHEASIYKYTNGKFVTKCDFNEGGSIWHPSNVSKYLPIFRDMGFDGTAYYLDAYATSPYFDVDGGFNLAKLEKNVNQIFEMYITSNSNEVSKTIDPSKIIFDTSSYYINGGKMQIHINNFTDIKMPDIKVLLNDEEITFEQPPYIENGTTLVPMRAIFEALGASVDWNGAAQTVTANKDDTEIILTLNENTATVNGRSIYLTAPAKLVNGFTVVPLRFVGESLGAEVNWDNSSRTITINN